MTYLKSEKLGLIAGASIGGIGAGPGALIAGLGGSGVFLFTKIGLNWSWSW